MGSRKKADAATVTVSTWIENSNRRRAAVQAQLLEKAQALGGHVAEGPVSAGGETFLRFAFDDRRPALDFQLSVDRLDASALLDDEDEVLRRMRARKASL